MVLPFKMVLIDKTVQPVKMVELVRLIKLSNW